ncbi:MAG: hypothetical protein IJY96_05110 [Oscillospiraceae bacterium]|nr:hypothetical protein [Oscillospiraceae bacterium]
MREYRNGRGMAERYYSCCVKCGREKLKKHMAHIYIKADGISPMRVLCHLCQDCLPGFLDELEVAMPDV